MSRVVAGLTVAGGAATLLTFGARHWWVADLVANLRVQQVVALLTLLVAATVLKRWRCALAVAVFVAIHVAFLDAWRTPAAHGEPDRGRIETSRVMLANVLTSNSQIEQIEAQIRTNDPDVFAILELNTKLATHLASGLSTSYPHRVARPMDHGNFGIGVYSKHPLEQVDVFRLNDSIESISAVVRCRTWSYRFVATHPLPPMSHVGFAKRNEHLFLLADRVGGFRRRQPELPIVVVGDLNLTPWSPIFRTLEDRAGLRRASERFDFTPTWYAGDHFIFGLVLDHVLIGNNLAYSSHQVGGEFGSDHRAVTVTIFEQRKADDDAGDGHSAVSS